MAFTTRTLTHTFNSADGSAAIGSVELTLTEDMTNGSTTLAKDTVIIAYFVAGVLSQAVTCNTDIGTVPINAEWRVDIRIQNSDVQTFFIVVPPGETVDLFTLIPEQEQIG